MMKEKKSMSMKAVAALLAIVLLIGCAAGGTLAWLVAKSQTVTNTFSVGNITVELKEHALKDDGTLNNSSEVESISTYKILPGTEQPKDPFVRIKGNSEDCWVFVQIKETNNMASGTLRYVSWAIAEGWTELNSANGVSTYYRTDSYTSQASDTTYSVLKDNEVTYSADLTKAMLDAASSKKPDLTIKAFAVQSEAATTASDAWAKVDATEKLS